MPRSSLSVVSRSFVAFLTLLAGLTTPVAAQDLLEAQRAATSAGLEYYFPTGVDFLPEIPTPEEFLGYPIGSYHTRHDRIGHGTREPCSSGGVPGPAHRGLSRTEIRPRWRTFPWSCTSDTESTATRHRPQRPPC